MKNIDFHLIFHVYVYMVHLPYLGYILNGLIKMPTDCSVDLIFIWLVPQLYYFEYKNLYMAKYLYLVSDFNSLYMIKIDYTAK